MMGFVSFLMAKVVILALELSFPILCTHLMINLSRVKSSCQKDFRPKSGFVLSYGVNTLMWVGGRGRLIRILTSTKDPPSHINGIQR